MERFAHLSVNWCFSASIGSFQGLPAEASEVTLLSQRLALKYNTTPPDDCQHFLTSFFQFLCAWGFGGKIPTETNPLRHRCAMPERVQPYIITLYRKSKSQPGIDGGLYYPPESAQRCQEFPCKILFRKISAIFGDCYKTQNIVVFCLTCH